MKKLRSIPAPDFGKWCSFSLAAVFFLLSYSCFSQDTLSLEESIKYYSDDYLTGTQFQHLSMAERQQKSKELIEQSQLILRGIIDTKEEIKYSEKQENGIIKTYLLVPFHIEKIYKGSIGEDTLVWLKLPINSYHPDYIDNVFHYKLMLRKGFECVILCKPAVIGQINNQIEKNIDLIFELEEENRFSIITSFPNTTIWVGLYGQVFKSSKDVNNYLSIKEKELKKKRMKELTCFD